ncbi:nuclear distribution protein nudE-like 1 [Corticium candelabrum]|uniref:nuclear distribution protein nudE-like 1 n=1 Tax=Corticium candelabrum TaxID=121492 RepID=UPI002E37B910|nr:nuclear distribution protein nudE-like 1 [Corticium candelabrum]
MSTATPALSSAEEEILYWRRKAEETEQSLQEARLELDEFQEGSRELEAELEAQLEQAESKAREMDVLKTRLEMENEALKERLEAVQNESFVMVSSLQEEIATLTLHRDTLQKYVRELEQSNDDLERLQRATVASLEDFDAQLNRAIERNAFLETELDDKATLQESVQRLKDEARDLRSELAARAASASEKLRMYTPSDHDISGSNLYANLPLTPTSTSQGVSTPGGGLVNDHTEATTPLTQSTRIAALNIVGDLLRKVGALETKLATSRNIRRVKAANSPTMSPRGKRVARSTSTSNTSNSVKETPQGGNGMLKITV